MNRNQNSHFAKNPQVQISRSKFDRSSSVKLSFNVGDIVPFYVDEVLPGDTFQIDTAKLVRMQTLVTPVMDDIYLDTYYFFVPNRLVWEHWQQFMGENSESPWIPQTQYSVPQMKLNNDMLSSDDFYEGSVFDYFGIPKPLSDGDILFNALPLRAYALIWNEWFRDQNLQNPINIHKNDSEQTAADFMAALKQADENMDGCMRASKFRDYFTTCLPSPQKGPDVLLPLGSWAPVKTRKENIYNYTDADESYGMPNLNWFADSARLQANTGYNLNVNNNTAELTKMGDSGFTTTQKAGATGQTIVPNNLWADLENATAATINQLRLAFQIQKIYERDARGGTRYIEILANHFGVTSPDSRMQRPEYLGGNRMLINVNQVVQNSETQETPQGTTTAYSLTTDVHSDFTHSFVEHGFLIGVCVARYNHTYQNGLERFWSRKDRFDYYFPILANIGEQPVYNKEIYCTGSSPSALDYDDDVFGYNEAWADYRYKPNRVAGEMRSSAKTSLDMWHLADDYSSTPALSPSWIAEDKNNVNRCLAVTSDVSNQLFGDFYIKNQCTRAMPVYSIPGLIDHH